MLPNDSEVGFHTKCPKLNKMCDFPKWKPRFKAHLGYVHLDCVQSLEHECVPIIMNSVTLGNIEKLFS